MSDNEIYAAEGLFDGYQHAYQALDGSHFQRRTSKRLPAGVRRREMFGWKHRWAECQNVQAAVNHFGMATEVLTGVPGAMPDSTASQYICQDEYYQSTLVDDGYPAANPIFVPPDGTDSHKEHRSVIERYFGRLKLLWQIVGSKYCKGFRYHSLCIRAAFILTNMVIYFEGSLNQ
eukprot:165214_1